MLTNINRTLSLKGISGSTYEFSLLAYESFDDLKMTFRADVSALYLFVRRVIVQGRDVYNLIYLGETSDLSTRFHAHHKEQEIMHHNSNCVGIYVFVGSDSERKRLEEDILSNYDFPCNEKNN